VIAPFAAPAGLVDAVAVEPDGAGYTVTARHTVRADDPNLAGHFPGNPIFPGVFVLEFLEQAVSRVVGDLGGPPVRLVGIRSVRFLAPATPGDELTLALALSRTDDGWLARGHCARADGTRNATVTADFAAVGHG
jgi:3-hydroxyacyl-[acyl-carrier-protein] dehydratase